MRAWGRPGDKPLYEPMMVGLLRHICVTRPQWVNTLKKMVDILWHFIVCLFLFVFKFPEGVINNQPTWTDSDIVHRHKSASQGFSSLNTTQTITIFTPFRASTMKIEKFYHTWVWNRGICRRVIVRPRSHILVMRRRIMPITTIQYFTFSLGK